MSLRSSIVRLRKWLSEVRLWKVKPKVESSLELLEIKKLLEDEIFSLYIEIRMKLRKLVKVKNVDVKFIQTRRLKNMILLNSWKCNKLRIRVMLYV
jgi:hypothetical protein